jgi:hypothetical protein
VTVSLERGKAGSHCHSTMVLGREGMGIPMSRAHPDGSHCSKIGTCMHNANILGVAVGLVNLGYSGLDLGWCLSPDLADLLW